MSSNYNFLYQLDIQNGTICLGSAVRYYSVKCLDNKNHTAIIGKLWKCEAKQTDTYERLLPYGTFPITFNENKLLITSQKVGDAQESLIMNSIFAIEVNIKLISTPEYSIIEDNYLQVREDKHEVFKKVIDDFIHESKKYYDMYITEVEDKPGKVGVYIFDEYWELLNRHEPRKISTIHLDGMEQECLASIQEFLSPENKKRYSEIGIPYKNNIMFEGYPGTGKTSLIFAIASELDRNIAIINFSKDMDDNNFMRAIRRLPKKCILVLEDIDVLFKERKENDGFKSTLSFSALLNTLDGLAFRQGTITIMTTNYICNLDSALKRPGRIDKIFNFKLATKGQSEHMFHKFFPGKEEEFSDFYKQIKHCKYTTAILQQYFMWYKDMYENLIDNIEEFKELCQKHNYEASHNLYS